MHRFDNCIKDIDMRLNAIIQGTFSQEEPSLQESLASFGWILLDSAIVWRTYRYLLRDYTIPDDVHDKWFKTPSSYTASQLMAIWHFNDSVQEDIRNKTGKKFSDLINKEVQIKRNSVAHFTQERNVTGADVQEIKKIYAAMKSAFSYYELLSFVDNVNIVLKEKGVENCKVLMPNGDFYERGQFQQSIQLYEAVKEKIVLVYEYETQNKYLVLSPQGCEAGADIDNCNAILNDLGQSYSFGDTKSYYMDVNVFTRNVMRCWSLC